MLFKKLILIAASTIVLGSVQAQTMHHPDTAPQVDVAAINTANMKPVTKPVKKTIKKSVVKNKSTIKHSTKKHSKHTQHAACDPKPEIVTCTMPAKP